MSVEETASGSWVVEIERYISGDTSGEMARGPKPGHSIYRVPEYIKCMTNPNAYRPQVVSLGPFHHGDPALVPMEKHKCRAVASLVKRSGKPLQEFIAAVEEIKGQLQDAYENLEDIWYHDTRFVEMMLKDGCFLLEMWLMIMLRGRVEDYEPDDPVFSEHGCLCLFAGIRSDVVLMENQLPLLLLQKLMRTAYADKFQDDEAELNNLVLYFLCTFVTRVEPVNDHLGLHPLDVLQKGTTGTCRYSQRPMISTFSLFMPCAAQLHEAGIHVKLSDAKGLGGGVTFKGGVLYIPSIFLYDKAERIFLNLMAFERLHPRTGNDVMAFVFFMDLLISTTKDVALLRSQGIIKNGLGSDEAVVNLIKKTLTKSAVLNPESSLSSVIREVYSHYKNPWNKWRASFRRTYFSNPWLFSPALILFVATIIQTIYTVLSFYNQS